MYGPRGLASGLGGILAFLFRLTGEGVVEMEVAGEEAVILGTGEWLMGLDMPGS